MQDLQVMLRFVWDKLRFVWDKLRFVWERDNINTNLKRMPSFGKSGYDLI